MKRKLRGFKRSAIELDFNLYRRNVPVPGISGAELSVIDIRPEGVERTILFVHGYAGCAETWEHQINYFSRGFRVVVPDLRGHGQSDAPFTNYSMPEIVADLNAIRQELRLPQKFALAGHSFGGSICVEYAYAHPETLEYLVLIATAGEYPLPRAASLLYRLPTVFFRPWWKYRPRWNADIHVMKRMMLNNLVKWQGWSKMNGLETPTLIITGERDNYFPRSVYDRVGQTVPGADVVDIGASKHKVQLERHRAVNRAIERFVSGDRQGGSWRSQGQQPVGKGPTRVWLSAYHPGTPPTVPLPDRPLHEFLRSSAEWLPKKTATVFYGKKLTYRQLDRQASQFAHVLRGLGMRPGERVMLVLPNVPQFIVAYLGSLRMGGVIVLVNPDADATRIVRVAQETESRVLVTLEEFSDLARAVTERSCVEEVITASIRDAVSRLAYRNLLHRWGIGEPAGGTGVGRSMKELFRDAPTEFEGAKVEPDAPAAILYTSGTTDDPKGVTLTHRNLVANTIQVRHWIPDLHYGRETTLAVLPFLHAYGLVSGINLPIAIGATIVLLPVFEVMEVLRQIKAHRPSIFPGVPSMYAAINQAPGVRAYGLSSIKACISGAAPLPVEVQEAFEKLTHGRLVEGYGLTEASPVTHANPLTGKRKTGTIGVPIPNTDAQILDLASGEPLPPGHIGELVVRGPQVMKGYWGDSGETDRALEDGWLHTGDVALMDEEGYFQIIGRRRDTILAGDFSVYPRDVEEVLYENSKVQEAAVVGVPHAESGQRVKAFVVPRPGTSLTSQELLSLCQRRLEEYAVPWEIEFRDELPKSFAGKVVRRLLVEQGADLDQRQDQASAEVPLEAG